MAKQTPQKTFLPQHSILPLPMRGWTIISFAVSIISVGYYVNVSNAVPSGYSASTLSSSNEIWKLFLVTTAVLVLKTHAMAWMAVYYATIGNSFSKNPEDLNTGDTNKPVKTRETDPNQDRAHRIHNNDLENVPMALILHLLLVLVGADEFVARLSIIGFTVTRLLHTFWYFNAGSHEIRAMLYSAGITFNCIALGHLLRFVEYI